MSLEFRHIAHAYGHNRALNDISFTAPQGEITCLLGSSGCGKSTLLNLAAGLLPVQQGSVYLNGELLADEGTSPPPELRPVGLVFQDGALFPHMTIAQNVAFGLHKDQRSDAVIEQWLDRVGLASLGGRYPHELSGGQQQRAALARAMAPQPQVLLMDEPFASVDIVLRRSLRRECRALLREQGATVILVTHDPEEALDIGDRIAVMDRGEIVQFGTPHDLYDAPSSASVGAIFGGAQVIAAERVEGGLATAFGTWPLTALAGDPPDSLHLELLLRADGFELSAGKGENGLIVRDIRRKGALYQVVLANADGVDLTVEITDASGFAIGESVQALPRRASVLAFPAAPGAD
ncbi:MAG: ABC transporter ATP-binding protein [Pseudomonadota bacterium]